MTAAAWDLWTRRIPNMLLLAAVLPAAMGLLLTGKGALGTSALDSVLGLVTALLLLLPGYAFGKLGAGDVKFAAILGLLIGVPAVFLCLWIAAVLLGVAGLWFLRFQPGKSMPVAPALAAGYLAPVLHNAWPG